MLALPLLPRRDERGASSVEYGLLVVAIAAVIAIIAFALGGVVGSLLTSTCHGIDAKANTSASC